MSESVFVVSAGDARVGLLRYDSRDEAFAFSYDHAWAARANAFPLSPAIPLQGPPASAPVLRRYLENLLPQGEQLQQACAFFHLGGDRVFGLLQHCGADMPGALRFDPQEAPPTGALQLRRKISVAELQSRIAERASRPFAIWDNGLRAPLPGSRDKLAVLQEGEHLFLVEGTLSSSHILKLDTIDAQRPHLLANEYFCLRLAAAMGLPVAAASLLRLPQPALLLARFDRRSTSAGVARLHIIDACQALDFPAAYRYEKNRVGAAGQLTTRDGVGFSKLFSLQAQAAGKVRFLRGLADWVILNFLIGNTDAHGKNLSFFCRHEGLELAPLYDLACLEVYGGGNEQAMAFGDVFAPDAVTPAAMGAFLREAGLDAHFFRREAGRLARLALAQAPVIAADPVFLDEERALLQRVLDHIGHQAGRLVALVA